MDKKIITLSPADIDTVVGGITAAATIVPDYRATATASMMYRPTAPAHLPARYEALLAEYPLSA